MRTATIRIGILAGAALLLAGGCAPWYAQSDREVDAERDDRITIRVIVTGNCRQINLPTEDNECRGVKRTDGVSCGQPADTLVWAPGNGPTRILDVQFVGDSPCTAAPVMDPGTGEWSCRIAGSVDETADTKEFQLFAYDLKLAHGGNECEKYDPYFIRSNR